MPWFFALDAWGGMAALVLRDTAVLVVDVVVAHARACDCAIVHAMHGWDTKFRCASRERPHRCAWRVTRKTLYCRDGVTVTLMIDVTLL